MLEEVRLPRLFDTLEGESGALSLYLNKAVRAASDCAGLINGNANNRKKISAFIISSLTDA